MARARKKTTTTTTVRATTRGGNRSQSRKPAAAAPAEIEVVEEEKGMGIDEGIVLATTIALVAAIVLMEVALQTSFGAGVFG